MIRLGMKIETQYIELNARSRHKNQGEISKGSGSARVGLRRGDSHFWVIRPHEFNGTIFFLI
jgi:hypothetical protein